MDHRRENCFGPRYLYCTHQIGKTQAREFSVISKGCGVWGFTHFQGKSSENFPPTTAMSSTFWWKKSLKVLSNKGFRLIQPALVSNFGGLWTANPARATFSVNLADLAELWTFIDYSWFLCLFARSICACSSAICRCNLSLSLSLASTLIELFTPILA